MESYSILYWFSLLIVVLMGFVSPIMGIIRGVQNSSVAHALLSHFIPLWGLIYFLAVKNKKFQTAGPSYIDVDKKA